MISSTRLLLSSKCRTLNRLSFSQTSCNFNFAFPLSVLLEKLCTILCWLRALSCVLSTLWQIFLTLFAVCFKFSKYVFNSRLNSSISFSDLKLSFIFRTRELIMSMIAFRVTVDIFSGELMAPAFSSTRGVFVSWLFGLPVLSRRFFHPIYIGAKLQQVSMTKGTVVCRYNSL